MKKPTKFCFIFLYVQFVSFLIPYTIMSNESSSSYFNISLQDLMDVEVVLSTAGKTSEKIADIPASVVLVDRGDIKRFGYRSIEEILNHIPGLFSTNDYSWDGQNYGVRGFWSGVVNRHMIVMVNGVSQVNDYQSNFPLNNINVPVEAIERIEVIRGPMSVIYGTGAFFGVINIITARGNDVSETSAAFSYGNENTYKIFFQAQQNQNDIKHNITIASSGTNGIDQPLNKMSENAAIFPLAYNTSKMSTDKMLSGQYKYFNLQSAFKSLYAEVSLIESDDESYLFYPSYKEGTKNATHKVVSSLGIKKAISSKVAFNSKLTYQFIKSDIGFDWFIENFIAGQKVSTTTYEFDTNINCKLNSSLDLLLGYSVRSAFQIENSIALASIPDPIMDNLKITLSDNALVSTHAVYSQINYSPVDRLKLVAGIRAEYMPEYDMDIIAAPTAPEVLTPAEVWRVNYNYDEWELIPRIAALFTLNSDHIIKLLYGEAINRPSFQQTIDDIFLLQSRLKPEKIKTYEINYLGSFIDGYTLSLGFYRNELNNLLIRDHSIDTGTGAYTSFFSNAGEMLTHGIELTAKTQIFDDFFFDASLTYQKTEDQREKEREVAYSPAWLGYLKASYVIKHTTLALSARYVDTMRPYYDPIMQNSNGSTGRRIGSNVPGYVSVGANVRIDNILNKFYLSLHGTNLLDEAIYFPVFTNNPWADKGTMDWGRRLFITLGVDL